MSWVICEIRDGATEVTTSDDVTTLILDWDNVADDWAYAADKLDELADLERLAGDLPPEDPARIRARIRAVWPEEGPASPHPTDSQAEPAPGTGTPDGTRR
jgi:hypothetical protein